MTRTKTGFVTKKRHKKIIKFNKGYKGSHSRLFKTANQESMHSFAYAYKDRKKRKSTLRKIWIKQINNTSKNENTKYSKIIKDLKDLRIKLNRKTLAKISVLDDRNFKNLIKKT